MIIVTVEIWPQGDEAARRTIATARIANVSGGSAIVTEQGSVVCDYAFAFEEATSGLVPYPLETKGLVYHHPRRQSVWRLIWRALDEALHFQREG